MSRWWPTWWRRTRRRPRRPASTPGSTITAPPWRSGRSPPAAPTWWCAGSSGSAREAVAQVRDAGRVDHLDELDLPVAEAVQQPLSFAEEDRRDVQQQLVDQAGGHVLAPDGGPAGDEHVLVA